MAGQPDPNSKQLLKILVGAAWLDGEVQPEEQNYLRRVAAEQGVADDPEVQTLLEVQQRVSPTECYNWLADYLGPQPQSEDYQRLLDSISALVYSDGDIDAEEAKLLTQLQSQAAASDSPQSAFNNLLKGIKKLYWQRHRST